MNMDYTAQQWQRFLQQSQFQKQPPQTTHRRQQDMGAPAGKDNWWAEEIDQAWASASKAALYGLAASTRQVATQAGHQSRINLQQLEHMASYSKRGVPTTPTTTNNKQPHSSTNSLKSAGAGFPGWPDGSESAKFERPNSKSGLRALQGEMGISTTAEAKTN